MFTYSIAFTLAKTIDTVATILKLIILIRVLLSWLAPYTRNDFTNTVYAVSEPLLRPFRGLFPNSRVDFSPLLAYLAISVVNRILFYIIFL